MELDKENVSNGSVVPIKNFHRMKGMRIRDEFLCPITYDLFRDPYIASDGNSYEKSALEKWMTSCSPRNNQHSGEENERDRKYTSPLTGDVLPKGNLIFPNITLKKLIADLINEGGLGLYTQDSASSDHVIDVYTERVLVFKCLGPPENTEWMNQSFHVSPRGLIGGRKITREENNVKSNKNGRDVVVFSDSNVSRDHFEVKMVSPGAYAIRDLGSTCGTYMRIPFGDKRALSAGMIIAMGNHQFTVSAIDDSGCAVYRSTNNGVLPVDISSDMRDKAERKEKKREEDKLSSIFIRQAKEGLLDGVESERQDIDTVIQDAEHLVRRLAAQRERLETSSSYFNHASPSDDTASSVDGSGSEVASLEASLRNISDRLNQIRLGQHPAEGKVHSEGGTTDDKGSYGIAPAKEEAEEVYSGKYATRRCYLTCCAPEGSPLLGHSFVIGPRGLSIGRKPTTPYSIAVSGEAWPRPHGDQYQDGKRRVYNLDTHISGEHAQISLDQDSGSFSVRDGDERGRKGSTNGTWWRLSGPSQESALIAVTPGHEVLVNNIRFSISEETTVMENQVNVVGHANQKET